jgi:hypothetical protein
VSVLPLFVCVRTQLFVVVAEQLLAEAVAQTPAVQVCPDGHTSPHLPQLFASVWVLAQKLPHSVCPVGHEHVPEVQIPPDGHTLPQAPQLFASVDSLTQPRLEPQYV